MKLNKTVCMVLMALGVPVAMGAGRRAATGGFVIAIDRARVTQARPERGCNDSEVSPHEIKI